jgi:hypothetical protein
MSSVSTGTTPPGAGRTAAVVVISVAVLGAVGGIFGYLIGAKANPSGGTPSASASASRTPTTPSSSAPKLLPPCPAFIQQHAQELGASGTLRQELYILTAKNEIWICKEDGGPTWCQGHNVAGGRYPHETPVEGRTGLLLHPVNGLAAGKFQCTYTDKDGVITKFTASTKEFVIEYVGKSLPTVVEPVIEHMP